MAKKQTKARKDVGELMKVTEEVAKILRTYEENCENLKRDYAVTIAEKRRVPDTDDEKKRAIEEFCFWRGRSSGFDEAIKILSQKIDEWVTKKIQESK